MSFVEAIHDRAMKWCRKGRCPQMWSQVEQSGRFRKQIEMNATRRLITKTVGLRRVYRSVVA